MRALFVICASAYALTACGDPAVRITKRETREVAHLCVKSFPTTPLLTFGIDNGLLTDYRLPQWSSDGEVHD